MLPTYHLQIITPKGIAYEGDVVHSLVPAESGFVGVLANHAAYVTSSAGGWMEVRERDGAEKKFSVGEGFFEIAKNRAVFLTQSFTSPT